MSLVLLVPGLKMGGGGTVVAVPVRTILLFASQEVVKNLPARQDTGLTLPAGSHTSMGLAARANMSISSNLSFFRGEDVTLDFQMMPSVDVTGWTISFKVADKLGGTVQLTKSATIVDGPRGKFRVTLSSASTSGLAVGRYVWDARRTDSGSKATLADGYLDLKQEVTA